MHHYCTALTRSVMPSLGHRHTKVRIAVLGCVQALVMCPFKDKRRGGGVGAIEDLMGHRDANVIPMCAFYEGETRINYFGKLLLDGNVNFFHEIIFTRIIK